ncbi:MAG: DUF2795 domain-containing protein [Nesterenkonia sp.]|uniref:DUF2795 domain-containing protein n=1 Tax=Nesterenkonia marinintestina TaxID=2979865 RepID=UPI0021C1F0D7|nr:DUF2795 domain-containing protein [Nesterenkonia sp. GX14115]MDO5493639.1 DUF2795 domain-containing protein [Nesterenkonia sp.]
MTTRDDLRASKALQGADFPASKQALIDYAQSRGVDQKSLQALHALPDREFESKDDVTDAVPQEPEGEDAPGGTAR